MDLRFGLAEVLNKRGDLTAVLIETMAVDSWSVGGVPVAVAAHLDAKVTSGTNTSEEQARFVEAAEALLRDGLGPDLPLATYVVVHEVPADAWGYGGLTQKSRASK